MCRRIRDYLEGAGHGWDLGGALFRRMLKRETPDRSKRAARGLNASTVYRDVVHRYGLDAGIDVPSFSPHSLRATAATNAEGGANLEQPRDWLGHANIATTTLYDKRRQRPEDCPTFKVNYKRRPRE